METSNPAQAQNSLVFEATGAVIEDLIIPLDGFDLAVGHPVKAWMMSVQRQESTFSDT